MALPKAHHIETLSGFNSLKFSYDSTNTHYFTGGTSTVVEGTPDILYTDIAYIKPLSAIYTHAKIYPCPVLEYDDVPTDGSGNPVTSDGLYDELRIVNTPTLTVGNTTYPIVYLDANEFQFLEYDYWDTWHEVYVIPHLDDDKAYVIRNIGDSRYEGEAKQVMFSNYGNFIIKFEDINSVSVQTDYVGYLRIYSDTGNESSYHVGENWISMNVSSNSFNVTNNDGEGGTNDNDTTIPYYGIESDNDITTIQNAVEDIPSGSGSSGVVTLKAKVLELEGDIESAIASCTYTAGTGLKLSNNQFSLNVPRVARTANSLPGTNTAIFEEYSSGGNYDLPSNALYHIITMQGNDTTTATQLALCVNNDAVYYRRMTSSIWQPWVCLNPTMDSTPTAGNTNNTVSSAGVKTYVDNAVSTKQVLLSEADYTALQTKDPNIIYYTY